jgi:hypothetical protein
MSASGPLHPADARPPSRYARPSPPVNGPNEVLACPTKEEALPYTQLLEEEVKLLMKYK